MQDEIAEILDICQRESRQHDQGLKRLQNLASADYKIFKHEFCRLCWLLLPTDAKFSQSIDRAISFVVKFSSALRTPQDGESCFAFVLVRMLLKLGCRSGDKLVRFRATQLVSRLISSASEEDELSEELWLNLRKQMLSRLSDSHLPVRLEAIGALQRLQLPKEADDPTTAALLKALGSDASAQAREAILSALALTRRTLSAVVDRVRDSAPLVRATAFRILARSVPVEAIARSDRAELLLLGFRDTDATVRSACALVAEAWITQAGSLQVFIGRLDPTDSSVETLFPFLTRFKAEWTPPPDPSDSDYFYFRLYCYWLHRTGALEELEASLPETTVLDNHYVVQQLLRLVRIADTADEAGRRNLTAFVVDALRRPESTPLVEELIQAAALISEVLSEFLDQDESEVEWSYILVLCCALLSTLTPDQAADGFVEGLFGNVLAPLVSHGDDDVRLLSVKAIGLWWTLRQLVTIDGEALEINTAIPVQLLLTVIENDSQELRETALRALVDLLLVSSTPSLSLDNEDKEYPCVRILFNAAEMPETAGIAVEGLAKLILAEKIRDPEILANLLAMRVEEAGHPCLTPFFERLAATKAGPSDLTEASLQVWRAGRKTELVAKLLFQLLPSAVEQFTLVQGLLFEILTNAQSDENVARLACCLPAKLTSCPPMETKILRYLLQQVSELCRPSVPTQRLLAKLAKNLVSLDLSPDIPLDGATKRALKSRFQTLAARPKSSAKFTYKVKKPGLSKLVVAKRRRLTEVLRVQLDLNPSPNLASPSSSSSSSSSASSAGTSRKSEVQAEVTPPPAKRQRTDLSGICVAFDPESGSGEHRAFLGKLGVTVFQGAKFTSQITHLVVPKLGHYSEKQLCAALTRRWIVGEDWLVESERLGHLAPEADFGSQSLKNALQGHTVYVSPEVRKARTLETILTKLGRMQVAVEAAAEYRIVSESDAGPGQLTPRSLLGILLARSSEE